MTISAAKAWHVRFCDRCDRMYRSNEAARNECGHCQPPTPPRRKTP